ncbi:SpaH/EbpB family LPXTG-anchored major pilin [Mediterraneibacter faecis]|uniref:SpaH/EbpB family LPXTG-anchored major pilin n=1 Tax=Mediterraneibacter faecis TaxID=592978 RepID=UPI001D0701A3|nr:SpaH/EbpB family LPXTG-anchored major pilin [Mediterraneibacter faecis]MCB5892162.1 SpaH/EbpB family LPXTG-anchored major pilin [Lachnospiraceae bacterium 210521-DFI.4.71]MCB7115754.1 SpaH/EbpB family LPXTG-anchored major pilin [Mediterraneibacter faecis]MCB7118987.1 SpaH/EbpB family LPXTG-anchored major pilin [Mediterraneibacter faecis]MCB7291316.1 SpaH/EbpB family LPXTG-anchored major pilin [Mediterraneibacter faecis]MCB7426589.1 SpaH/EbpB family LPXTG-anchored major pilin [Mediterraneiba
MKKNVLKKFAAAALAAATVMSSMSVMAFAAEPETGSVTITKYMSNTGAGKTLSPEEYTGEAPNGKEEDLLQNVEFAYVKVGDRVQVDTAEGKSSKTEIQYKVTDGKFLEAIGIDKTKASANFTQTELNNAIKTHKNDTIKFVKENADNANKKSTVKTTGEAKFEGLSLHKLYVFAETDATNAVLASDGKTKVNVTKVSVPFLVSLPFTGNDGKPVTALKVYPKNSTGEDTIDKKIVEDDGEKASTTANIGDTINYKVTYSIPVGENGLESLVVTDTMSKGLTFVNNADNIKVLNGDVVVDKTMYTVNANKDNSTNVTTITITFDSDNYCKKLAPNTTPNFTITYKATLNENAVLGQSGNTNDVFVTYTGDVKRETEHKDTKVFTYGIDLLKMGEGTTAGLKDVKFELTDGANEIKVLKSGDAYYPSNGTGASSTVTTDEQGKIYIRGLKPGTYQLKETKTNAGYVLLKEPVKIVITEDSTTPGKATASVGNKEVTMNADNGSATAIVPLTVVNSKGFDLPATGGRGIALFTIAGIAIVAAAGSLLFMRKRSK